MTDLEKPKTTRKKKPPTQTAGVSGIDGHGGMGEAVEPVKPAPKEFEQYIDWHKLVNLPAFQMFVQEQSGHSTGNEATEWVRVRREALSDSVLYGQYAEWHADKGFWLGESPTGKII